VKRGWEIIDEYQRGLPVICSGIGTMLHAQETSLHADAVFLGGRIDQIFDDFRNKRLRKMYDYLIDFPLIFSVGTARRDILDREQDNCKQTTRKRTFGRVEK
jgi:hypothetical protein